MKKRNKGLDKVLTFLLTRLPRQYHKHLGKKVEPAQLVEDLLTIGAEFAINMIRILHRMSNHQPDAAKEFFNILITRLIYRAAEEDYLTDPLRKNLDRWLVPTDTTIQ
jgi:hypothetical protein